MLIRNVMVSLSNSFLQAPVWQFAPNSIHYLLTLWQRMVASVPYVKATEPHLLEVYTPEVSKAYITSRLDSVTMVIRDGLEDPLDDTGMVQQQLEQVRKRESRPHRAVIVRHVFSTDGNEYS